MTLLLSPRLPPFLNTLHTDASLLQVVVTYSGTKLQQYDIRARVRGGSGREARTVSHPLVFTGPGVRTFSSASAELIDPDRVEVPSSWRDLAIRGGVIPADQYELCVAVYVEDAAVTPVRCARTVAELPAPPQLLLPAEGGVVQAAQPTFSWAPSPTLLASAGVQYYVRLAEVRPGQLPVDALSSVPQHDEVVGKASQWVYPLSALPLESGKVYAWQVQALDGEGEPFGQNAGRSAIRTFFYLDPRQPPFEEVVLVPGYAVVEGLGTAALAGGPTTFTLSGSVQLRLTPADGSEAVLPVLANLVIERRPGAAPVVVGGTLEGSVPGGTFALGSLEDLVVLDRIRWSTVDGVTVTAALRRGGVEAGRGTFAAGPAGLSGVIEASGSAAAPLLALGDAPLRLLVTELSARLPQAQAHASGVLEVLEGATTCAVERLDLLAERAEAEVHCSIEQTLDLAGRGERLALTLRGVNGTVGVEWAGGATSYDLEAAGNIDLALLDGRQCGVAVTLGLTDPGDLALRRAEPNCQLRAPTLDLGFADFTLSRIELGSLSWSRGGGWDFALALDGELSFSAFGDWRLPSLEGVSLGRGGFSFPSLAFDESALGSLPDLSLGDFAFRPTRFTMPDFRFPWFDWDGTSAGDWDFTLDFQLRPGRLAGNAPACLQSLQVDVRDARFAAGRLSAAIPATVIDEPGCVVPFGTGYALAIRHLGGELAATASTDGLVVDGGVEVAGNLRAGEPFACDAAAGDGAAASVDLADTELTLRGDGLLEGSIDGLAPACPVEIGRFTARLAEVRLDLGASDGVQTAHLAASARLWLPDTLTGVLATGGIGIDLASGQLDSLRLATAEPFELGLPVDAPVLTFRLDRAELGLDGIRLDGRQQLLLAGDTVGTTFDALLLDPASLAVRGGRVVFDGGIGFRAGVDTASSAITHELVPVGTPLVPPGFLAEAGGSLVLDAAGLHATGRGRAALSFLEQEPDSLEAEFSEDFVFGVENPRVLTGRLDLVWRGQPVAWLDPDGFHLDPAYFLIAALPERLPLPTQELAYLQLRRGDTLLIDVTKRDDGSLTLNTRPGAPVQLVLPVLQAASPAPPTASVELRDLVLAPGTFAVTSGSIAAALTGGPGLGDLAALGLPIVVDTVRYDAGAGLGFAGRLTILDRPLERARASVTVDSAGNARATLDLAGLDEGLPLLAPTTRVASGNAAGMLPQAAAGVAFQIREVRGTVDVPLLGGGTGAFDFHLAGELALASGGRDIGHAAMAARFTSEGFTLESFEPTPLADAVLELDPLRLAVERLNSFAFSYDAANGFDFALALDASLRLDLADGGVLQLPLQGIELRDDGIDIPRQELNDGSNPPLRVPPLAIGGAELRVLGFRLPALGVRWAGGLSIGDFDPRLDFELRLPAVAGTAPALAAAPVTINDAGYADGIFTATLVPYTFADGGVRLPLADSLALVLADISGALTRVEVDGRASQGFELDAGGSIELPSLFADAGSAQALPARVRISTEGGVSGTITDFSTGAFTLGPLTVEIPSAELRFAFGDGKQEAILAGAATARLAPSDGGQPVEARGTLAVDLVSGNISGGSLDIQGPFAWPLPAENPLLTFSVNEARLDTLGLTFTGGGSVRLGEGEVAVRFNELRFDLQNLAVTGGSATIESAIALDIALGGQAGWSVVHPDRPFDLESGVRLGIPANASIDSAGVTVAGTAAAAFRLGDQDLAGLRADFAGFNIALGPARVARGRADLFILPAPDSAVHVAYMDSTGFNPDVLGAAALLLPDTLGLPTTDVAYVLLKQDDQLAVDTSSAGDLLTLSTRQDGLQLVLASLGGRTVRVHGSLSLNGSNQVVAGSLAAQLEPELDLQQSLGIPIRLARLGFQAEAGQGATLLADARLALPAALDGLDIALDSLVIGANGFERGSFTAGSCSATYDPNAVALVRQSFANDAISFAVTGAGATFDPDGDSFCFAADVASALLAGAEGDTAKVHLLAGFANGAWNFAADAAHLPDGIDLGVATFTPSRTGGLEVRATDDAFDVRLAGMLSIPELLGEEFEITVDSLVFGTSGVRVSASQNEPQQFALFDGILDLQTERINLALSQDYVLSLDMSGDMTFLERTIAFQGFRITSAGDVSLGGAAVNLLAGQPLEVFPSEPGALRLDTLVIAAGSATTSGHGAVLDGVTGAVAQGGALPIQLRVGGQVTLPEPLNATSRLGITVARGADGAWTPTVEGPMFAFGRGDQLGDNPATEFQLGDIATIDLTGVGVAIDLQSLADTEVYGSVSVYLQNDAAKAVYFGEPGGGDLRTNYGFAYSRENGLRWRVSGTGPGIEFNLGFFSLRDLSVSTPDRADGSFAIEIGAQVGVAIEGVGGSAGFEGVVISGNGIEDWGRISGPLELTVMDFVSLTIGEFERGSGAMTMLVADGGGAATKEVTVQTTEYLRFGGGESDAPALQISLGSTFSGGVDRVLFYRDQAGGTFLYIDNVNVSLQGEFNLSASLQYMNSPDGFLLRAAGVVNVGNVNAMAAGKFANIGGELSFGLFVAADVTIPIYAPIVTLTSIGGGFFYRPEPEDLDMVYDGLHTMDPSFRLIGERPAADDLIFAALLYGGVGLLGTEGVFVVTAKTLITITDDFTTVDATGVIFGQDGRLQAANYLIVDYGTANRFAVSGGTEVTVDYGILTARSDVNFQAIWNQGDFTWAVWGGIEAQVLVIDANGSFAASPSGVFFDLTVTGGIDVGIAEVSGGFAVAFWYVPDRSLGAYGEMHATVSVLGVEAGAAVKALAMVDGGGLYLYGAGRGWVDLWLDTVEFSVWVSLRNGDIDAGLGSDPAMEQLIADARGMSQQMEQQAAEAAAAAEAAREAVAMGRFAMSDEDLARAGLFLFSLEDYKRQEIAQRMMASEQMLANGLSSDMRWVAGQVIAAPDMPDRSSARSAMLQMNAMLDSLQTESEAVEAQLRQARMEATVVLSQAQIDLSQLTSPVVELVEPEFAGNRLVRAPSFRIDEEREAAGRQQLELVQAEIQTRDAEYRAAIDRLERNLALFDTLATQLNAVGRHYLRASNLIDFYYTMEGAYLNNTRAWAASRSPALVYRHDAIRTHLQNVTRAAVTGGQVTAPLPSIGYSRQNTLLALQGMSGQALVDSALAFQSQLSEHIRNQSWDALVFDFAGKGEELWYRMPLLGLSAVHQQADPWVPWQELEAKRADFAITHHGFTRAVDDFYSMKADALGLLYGMTGEYLAWRGVATGGPGADPNAGEGGPGTQSGGTSSLAARGIGATHPSGVLENARVTDGARRLSVDTAIAAIRDKRERIAQMLAVPEITEINVGTQYRGFWSWGTVSWRATHPVGLLEYAVAVSGPDAATGGEGELGSAGRMVYTEIHAFKRRTEEHEQRYRATVRARGIGGLTATRYAEFTVRVDDEGTATGNGSSVPAMAADHTPPAQTTVVLPYPVADAAGISGITATEGLAFTYTGPAAGVVEGPWSGDDSRHWSSDSTRLQLELTAADPESDVASFEVAIGTTPGAEDALRWTPVHGSWRNVEGAAAGTNRLIATLTGLRLRPGTRYFVSTRATNGEGLTGSPSTAARPLQVDVSPPQAPRVTVDVGAAPGVSTSIAATTAGTTTAPGWATPRVATAALSPRSIELHVVGHDPQSGVEAFEYVFSSLADGADALAHTAEPARMLSETLLLDRAPLSFTDSSYLHVRAVNAAGLAGPVTTQRVRAVDQTRPATPLLRAMTVDGGIRLYLPRLSTDPDWARGNALGVVYHVAAGTTPGGTDVLPWSAGVFFEESDLRGVTRNAVGTMGGGTAGYFLVPTSVLPGNQPLYFSIRAMNPTGITSDVAVSGPVDRPKYTSSGASAAAHGGNKYSFPGVKP